MVSTVVRGGVRPRQRASDTPDPLFATTLARGLEVLTAFRPDDPTLSNAEIAERTGLTRPTVSRLAGTLARLGYLRRSGSGRFRLTTHVLRVAYPVLAQLRIRQAARPLMRTFAEQIGGQVSIGTVDQLDAVYVETVRSHESAGLPDIGMSMPLVRSAMGRALLTMLEPDDRRAVLARVREETPALWSEFGRAASAGVGDCGKRGFALSLGDLRTEVHAVGAPLLITADGDLLAINCGIPVYRLARHELEQEVGPRLVALAAAIRALEQQKLTAVA